MDKGKDRAKAVAAKGLKKVEAYQKVFKSSEGQLVLDDMMLAHNMMSPTFAGGKVHEMLHKEGERNVILRILKILNTSTKDLRERIEAHERDVEE